MKSSDKYLIGCFVLVFLTLIEYCTVLLLKAKQKQRNVRIRGMIEAQVTFALRLASIRGTLTFFPFPELEVSGTDVAIVQHCTRMISFLL